MRAFKFRTDIKRDIDDGIAINKLYASDRDNLNDPSEMNFDDSEFIDFLELHNNFSVEVKKEYELLRDFMFKKCGILSLSKNVYNELLWAYYADGHKGFCIEYDTDVIMECYNYGLRKKNGRFVDLNGRPQQEPMVSELDIVYQKTFPKFDTNVMKRLSDTKDHKEILTCTIGTKSKSWKHEDEVRLIFSKNRLCEFDYRAVKGIYFGCRFDDTNNEINRIMELLKGRNIKYYKMKFNPKSYTLTYDELPDNYISAPEYVANNLPNDNVNIHSTHEHTDPYEDMLHKALEIVSKEPCINSIKYASVCTPENPMISVVTSVNDDFKIFPEKIFRFDMDIKKRDVRLRRFQFED